MKKMLFAAAAVVAGCASAADVTVYGNLDLGVSVMH